MFGSPNTDPHKVFGRLGIVLEYKNKPICSMCGKYLPTFGLDLC